MKLLQNSKFTGPALMLLLMLNTALLVMLLVKRPGPPPMMKDHGQPGFVPGPRDFLIHELKMNDQQEKKFDALILNHRSFVEKIQHDIQVNRDSLVSELSIPAIDSSKINSIAEKIGADQAQMEKTNFYHFKQVREICNPEQQVKFDTIIRGALNRMGPPPPGPHPPGIHPPPPPPGHGPPPPHGNHPPPPPGN